MIERRARRRSRRRRRRVSGRELSVRREKYRFLHFSEQHGLVLVRRCAGDAARRLRRSGVHGGERARRGVAAAGEVPSDCKCAIRVVNTITFPNMTRERRSSSQGEFTLECDLGYVEIETTPSNRVSVTVVYYDAALSRWAPLSLPWMQIRAQMGVLLVRQGQEDVRGAHLRRVRTVRLRRRGSRAD